MGLWMWSQIDQPFWQTDPWGLLCMTPEPVDFGATFIIIVPDYHQLYELGTWGWFMTLPVDCGAVCQCKSDPQWYNPWDQEWDVLYLWKSGSVSVVLL